MRFVVRAFLALILVSGVSQASFETYQQVRGLQPDGRTISVSDFTMVRDVFEFNFSSGQFHLLNDINGKTVGAVFLGQGTLNLEPVDPREIQNLRVMSRGGERFSDSFQKAMLLFADGTAEELMALGEPTAGSPSKEASDFRARSLRREKRDFRTNLHLRLAQDLINPPIGDGVFMAFVDFDDNPNSLVAVDPLGIDHTGVGSFFGVDGPEESMLVFMGDNNRGVAYLSHLKSEISKKAHRRCKRKQIVDAKHYSISTTIKPNREIIGTTTLKFAPTQRNVTLMPIQLMLPLRIQKVTLVDDGTTLPFIQEEAPDDLGSLGVEGSDAAILFPAVLTRGKDVTIRIDYQGNEVLEDAGDDNYFVGTRSFWYPNTGVFSDWATYDLEFFHPEGTNIVSIGDHIGDGLSEGRLVSRWQTTTPVSVAGFNYGRFKVVEQMTDTLQKA